MTTYNKFSDLTVYEKQLYYNVVYMFVGQQMLQDVDFPAKYSSMFFDDLSLKPGHEILIAEQDDEISGAAILNTYTNRVEIWAGDEELKKYAEKYLFDSLFERGDCRGCVC